MKQSSNDADVQVRKTRKPSRFANLRRTARVGERQPEVGRARLLTLDSLDQRTKAMQRVRKSIDAIESDLGGSDRLSTAERSLVQRCAILDAMASDQEAAYVQGQPIDAANYCTLVNALRRTFETVGLKRRSRDVTPTLKQYAAQREQRE